jgi:hypothetical protein
MSKLNCRIAALQMISGPRVGENLRCAGRLIDEAVGAGSPVACPA